MSVPKRLQSIAEVVVDCRWWKLIHSMLPYRYRGTQYIAQYECTNPSWCQYNVTDARVGGCQISGNVHKIPLGERP